jgi:hypothetical protein
MRLIEDLEEAIITIVKEAIGVKRPPAFNDAWEVLEAGERFKAARRQGFIPEPMSAAASSDDRRLSLPPTAVGHSQHLR